MAGSSRPDVHDQTLALAKQLIACPSLTPDDAGALDLIVTRLAAAGFTCERIDRGGVRNLWATRSTRDSPRGTGVGPTVCLAGHVDVVPPGPAERWTSDPFTPEVRNGYLFGRGAADMKASVAAMVTAAERLAAARFGGTLAVLLTADEEGSAIDGTAAVVERLAADGNRLDACIIGEPTSVDVFGDTIKNGRRGSLTGALTIRGVQCHIAYPERGRNPIHLALPALAELAATEWDRGNEYFAPTGFQIASVHAGAGAVNVVPGQMDVLFNFRFSTAVTADQLKARVHAILDAHAVDYEIAWTLSAVPFLSPRGGLVDVLSEAIEAVTEVRPSLSTSGGTSDGRFLASISNEVVEFGPVGASIHGIDEHVALADLEPLSLVYERAVARLLKVNA